MFKNGILKKFLNFNFQKFNFTIQLDEKIIIKPVKKEIIIDINAYFNEIDLRVGKIVEISEMKDSENLFCCKIDVGEKMVRDVGTAIRKKIKMTELENSYVIVFANLKQRKLGGF